MRAKCYIETTKDGRRIDEHDLKIIYQGDGYIHGLSFKHYRMIYHLQCKRCGNIFEKEFILPCKLCKANELKRLSKLINKKLKRRLI